LTIIEQPVASAAAILRTTWLIGKFHGVNAATGPTGSFSTIWRVARLKREGTMRPYTRRPSSANHSMMSAAAMASPLASTSGLPCSCVSRAPMAPARSRIRRGGAAHDLAALDGGHVAPGFEALLRGGQRRVQVGDAGMGHAADFLAGGGVENRQAFAVGGVLPLAVDEELGVGVGHGVSL
jgi:hypothetical protein